jgi:putative DNA-invertase from lambdoid prophage Rac
MSPTYAWQLVIARASRGLSFMAAAAQAQAEATKASQRVGIEHAKGRTDSPYLGRKPA